MTDDELAALPPLDGETMERVSVDVGQGVAPDDTYTPEMREHHAYQTRRLAEWRRTHPDAHLHIPAELPRADIKV